MRENNKMDSIVELVNNLREGFISLQEKTRSRKSPPIFDPGRIEKMQYMRFVEKQSLSVIGKSFGISRERVRQLIGNTGSRDQGLEQKSMVDQNLKRLARQRLKNALRSGSIIRAIVYVTHKEG